MRFSFFCLSLFLPDFVDQAIDGFLVFELVGESLQ